MDKQIDKRSREGRGSARVVYDTPRRPVDCSILTLLPFGAMVTSIEVKYVQLTSAAAEAQWAQRRAKLDAEIDAAARKEKRRIAAIKANATRKARKKST